MFYIYNCYFCSSNDMLRPKNLIVHVLVWTSKLISQLILEEMLGRGYPPLPRLKCTELRLGQPRLDLAVILPRYTRILLLGPERHARINKKNFIFQYFKTYI